MAETETVIQETTVTDTENQERTFTQSELDEILKSRLAKERAKFGNYEELQKKAAKLDEIEEASKSELQKATEKADALQRQLDELTKANEVRTMREKVASEVGIPASLLHGDTEESCVEQAKQLLAFKNDSAGYPTVRDGGEVENAPTKPKSNGEAFGEWLETQLS